MRSCFYILGDWLLAQHVLSGLNCFFDHGRLNANRQSYDDGIDVFASEEIFEGVIGCGRRVIVSLDGLRRAVGKVIGACFGARVDGFEGEESGCLNRWEMLCAEDVQSVRAITMPRK